MRRRRTKAPWCARRRIRGELGAASMVLNMPLQDTLVYLDTLASTVSSETTYLLTLPGETDVLAVFLGHLWSLEGL